MSLNTGLPLFTSKQLASAKDHLFLFLFLLLLLLLLLLIRPQMGRGGESLSLRQKEREGGRISVIPNPKKSESDSLKRVPTSKPPFTLSQIKKAIPPHCFQRSVLLSFSHLAYDLILASVFCYVAANYIHLLPHPLSYVAWAIYWAVQGSVFMRLWVLGHECGHHAFSDYQWLDDTVGFVLHSFLIVPYFSWKYSHSRHHSNIGTLDRDEVFVPTRKSEVGWWKKYLNNPPGRFIVLSIQHTLGWQAYLVFNSAGRSYERFASHYDPYSPIFNDRERLQVYISDAGVLAAAYCVYRLSLAKGLAWAFCVYGGPLVVQNGLLVAVSYLQHTHPSLPHYDSSGWDWLRGSLATVDRGYGIFNPAFHHLHDTHVAHHLFSTLPHYHAVEATKAIKPVLGEYYKFDGTPAYKALYRELKECIYVEPDEGEEEGKGVLWYRNKL